MKLTTAENYLLLTERIAKKPMLRSRFTSQAYFVLAVYLDLFAAHVLKIASGHVTFDKTVRLPDYLSIFVSQLTEALSEDDQLKNALKPVTSWDIANQIYDGIGAELLEDRQVERVVFQNNLKPHIIYVPTASARSAAGSWLANTLTTQTPALNLCVILNQMSALKWVVPDENNRESLLSVVRQQSAFNEIQLITETAADVITEKRFWLDSWLS
ncbi:hypothetical protein HC026_02940 [Lactobacillus sp. LC28-10]|uniref:Uncharacterized protein n=1 Tax=Secundilactobacillus angelensis TaxID=2722706 RepID=A0ABX1KXN3_9LACO|nr:hypothetical protein [Secundilactobacillus angelensis]MCH5461579.1 hypothetical protein [Secundilactobacillus angelensis]NLR17874.1 hypothetical protein [Secundilactobacillus angelensis]